MSKLDLVIRKGAKFDKTIVYKDSNKNPIDLTGYSAKMQIKANSWSSSILELSTSNGSLVLGGPAGTIQMILLDSATAGLSYSGTGVYELNLVDPSGYTKKLIEGIVVFLEEITV